MSFHENLKHNEGPVMGSDKSFGIIFCVIFGIIAFYPVVFGANDPRLWALFIMAFFGFSAFYKPEWLTWLNKRWFLFSILLQKIMVPLILGVMFYVMFTPIAFFLRLMGKDLLKTKYSDKSSYWVIRENYNAKEHMPNQF
jgi:hypothetical protein